MKNRIIVSSILTIALCLSMIAGSTFALFTSEDSVNIAVTSGKIEVVAEVDEATLATSSLGVAQTPGTFANGGSATLAGDTLTLDRLTPGDKATFSITVTNNSNVALQYRVGMTTVGKLGEVLEGSAVINNITYDLTGNPVATPWVTVEPSATIGDIQVTVELPREVGNTYQESSATITFIVEAVQGNGEVNEEFVPAGAYDDNGKLLATWNQMIADGDIVIQDGMLLEYNGNYKNLTVGGVSAIYEAFAENTVIENLVISEGVTTIGNKAIHSATNLKSVVLPKSLENLGYGAFNGCSSLESVTIPGGAVLADRTTSSSNAHTFAECTSLKEVIIEEGVTSIPSGCFLKCSSLETVVLPSTIETIGWKAFYETNNLANVYIYSKNFSYVAGNGGTNVGNVFNGNNNALNPVHKTIHVMNDAMLAVVEADFGGNWKSLLSAKVMGASNATDVNTILQEGGNVVFTGNVSAPLSNGSIYGTPCAICQTKGGVIDGNGNSLIIEKPKYEGYAIETYGGTIKNLVIDTAVGRGIVISSPKENIYIDNVVIDGPGYAINTTEHNGKELYVTNSTVNGWTSLAGLTNAYFTNCKLGENTSKYWQEFGYGQDYDRLIRPYCNATLTNCELEEGYYIDLSSLGADCEIVLDNCTVNGVVLTADNYADYITIELPSGRTLADCVVFR